MEESRTLNTSKNVLTGLINKIVLLILLFVSRKIFTVYIGIEYLGINGLFSNILTILSLADLGFGIAMSYSYYRPLAENDEEKLAALVNFYKRIYNIIALTVLIIGISVIPFLKYIINTDQPIKHLYIYYLIALSNTVVSYLFVYKSTIISADQKSYLINKYNIYVSIGRIIVQIISMIILKSYMIYAIIEVCGTIANNLIISNVADSNYPYIKKKVKLDKATKIDIFTNMKSVFLYKVSGSIMSGTDSIIMSSIVGTTSVGLYSNYLTITNQLISFVQILFSSVTASIGNLIIEDVSNKNYKVFCVMQMISHIISGFVAVCLFTLLNDFIDLWLGPQYSMGTLMAFSVAANTYFTIALQPIWSYRDASGLYNKTKYVMLITAIVNIILSIIMGIYMGAAGIILATVISRMVTYFWYEPYLVYKLYFKQSVSKYYLDFFVSFILIAFSYIISSMLWNRVCFIGWFGLIVKGLIYGIVILFLFLIRYYHTQEFKFCFIKLHRLLETLKKM